MSLEAAFEQQRSALTRRALRMTGDRQTAEDLCQEAFARAWRHLPRETPAAQAAGWLHRAVGNLAVDEHRRRRRRPEVPLDQAGPLAAAEDGDAVAEALGALSTHERFVLLLRYDAGFSHREVGDLLGIGEDAARKRVARARAAFRRAFGEAGSGRPPRVLLLVRDDDPAPYRSWLGAAGATVSVRRHAPGDRDVLLADALVITGSVTDIHPATYGPRPEVALAGRPDAGRDRRDLAGLRAALRAGLPTLGVCGGHQLLNVACGGTLAQSLTARTGDGRHRDHHPVTTRPGSLARRAIGGEEGVSSRHDQAVARVGQRLRVTAQAPDGVVEAIERTDRRFALGVQWRPQESLDSVSSRRLARLLLDAAERGAGGQ